jgi:hypothetical protein
MNYVLFVVGLSSMNYVLFVVGLSSMNYVLFVVGLSSMDFCLLVRFFMNFLLFCPSSMNLVLLDRPLQAC